MTLAIVFLRFLVAVVFTLFLTSGQEEKPELEREEQFLRYLMATSHDRLAAVAAAEKSWPAPGDIGYSSARSRKRRSVVSSGISADNRAMLIKVHNERRRQVQPVADDMLFMTWDDQVELVAQNHVNKCIFTHNSNISQQYSGTDYLGENLYTTTAEEVSMMEIVEYWYGENVDYNLGSNVCAPKKVCGHYTQVVWATSNRLGCGMARCGPSGEDSSKTFIICNYRPGGNIQGQAPYQSGGGACSKCPSGMICDNGLCRTEGCDGKTCSDGVLQQDTCECNCTGTGSSGYTCQSRTAGMGEHSLTTASLLVLLCLALI